MEVCHVSNLSSFIIGSTNNANDQMSFGEGFVNCNVSCEFSLICVVYYN